MKNAYETAKGGGKHAGFYRNNLDLPRSMLERGIRSMEQRMAEHQAWIANPYTKLPIDTDIRQVLALVTKKWPGDIARIKEEMCILQGILQDKGETP